MKKKREGTETYLNLDFLITENWCCCWWWRCDCLKCLFIKFRLLDWLSFLRLECWWRTVWLNSSAISFKSAKYTEIYIYKRWYWILNDEELLHDVFTHSELSFSYKRLFVNIPIRMYRLLMSLYLTKSWYAHKKIIQL